MARLLHSSRECMWIIGRVARRGATAAQQTLVTSASLWWSFGTAPLISSLPGTHVAYRKRSAARCQDLAAACGYVASAGLRRSCGTSLDCKTKIVVTRSTTGCVEISGQVALLSPKNAGVNSNNVLYRVSYMRHVTVHKLPIGVLHE